MQPPQAAGVAVGEGVVKDQRQATVVPRQQHLGQGQPQGRGQLFAHAPTELLKAIALDALLQLEIAKAALRIKIKPNLLIPAAQILKVGTNRLLQGFAIALGEFLPGSVK